MDAGSPGEEIVVETAGILRATVLGLGLTILVGVPSARAAEGGLTDYQGAWVLEGRACEMSMPRTERRRRTKSRSTSLHLLS